MGHAAELCAPPARADGYARRQPELTTLHRTLSAHWPAFVEQAEEAGGLPSFVMREVQDCLRCGLPEHGCALLVCLDCGRGVLVAFSCKHRAFCPSCCGRRMSDVAPHLVEHVLPEGPVRQWRVLVTMAATHGPSHQESDHFDHLEVAAAASRRRLSFCPPPASHEPPGLRRAVPISAFVEFRTEACAA
jgi:hypothetical protein